MIECLLCNECYVLGDNELFEIVRILECLVTDYVYGFRNGVNTGLCSREYFKVIGTHIVTDKRTVIG